jgi:hypothetical protein
MSRTIYAVAALLLLAVLACGSASSVSAPKATVAPILLGSDLTTIDVCQAIPQEDMEAVMGRKLISAPQPFDYYETPDASGCMYDGGKDATGEAHYGYVVFTPIDAYNSQPLYEDVAVSGIGESAYFNNGADTRQLWVKVNEAVAFVVANGDRANEEGLQALATLIVAAIK